MALQGDYLMYCNENIIFEKRYMPVQFLSSLHSRFVGVVNNFAALRYFIKKASQQLLDSLNKNAIFKQQFSFSFLPLFGFSLILVCKFGDVVGET